MHRRNPPAGNATFETLTVHELSAGISGGAPDDNAEHTIHGGLTLTGAPDTAVLTVEQHAYFQALLSTSRLEVGLTTAPDPAGAPDDPYTASLQDGTPYPDVYEGGTSPPEWTGLTVDEAGAVRTSGFVGIKDAKRSLILRAPTGNYYSFSVNAAGELAIEGTYIGPDPP